MMRRERRYGLILAMAMCMVYSCNPTSMAADTKAEVKVPRATTGMISIIKPDRRLAVGEYVTLQIQGMAAKMMPDATVHHFPKKNVAVVPAQTWGGEPFIWFGARAAGEYFIVVTVETESGLASAETVIEVGEPSPPPPPPPSPNPYTPDDEWKASVKPLADFRLERTDADALSGMYGSVARQIHDDESIKTTSDLRRLLMERGTPLGIKSKYPNLNATMDQIWIGAMTLELRTLDKDEATKLLNTIAWAIWEQGQDEPAALEILRTLPRADLLSPDCKTCPKGLLP